MALDLTTAIVSDLAGRVLASSLVSMQCALAARSPCWLGRADQPSLLPLHAERCPETRAQLLGESRASTIRGELAIGRGSSRHNLVFGRSRGGLTMMQSCASAAKLRGGGPILRNGATPWSAPGACLSFAVIAHERGRAGGLRASSLPDELGPLRWAFSCCAASHTLPNCGSGRRHHPLPQPLERRDFSLRWYTRRTHDQQKHGPDQSGPRLKRPGPAKAKPGFANARARYRVRPGIGYDRGPARLAPGPAQTALTRHATGLIK